MTTSDTHRTIGGRYRLDRSIGQGGMGTVWQGHDELLGREVAVKEVRFPPELGKQEMADLRERTLREARATARLSHPNVDHDLRRGRGGRSALDRHGAADDPEPRARCSGTTGPLPPHRVAEIGLGVLSALETSHGQGIVHRDVKPSNVLITADGRAGAHRLRHRHDGRRPGAHLHRRGPRLPRLHVAGTRSRQGVRAGERPLVPGRDVVLRGRGPAAVRVGQRARHADRGHLRPGARRCRSADRWPSPSTACCARTRRTGPGSARPASCSPGPRPTTRPGPPHRRAGDGRAGPGRPHRGDARPAACRRAGPGRPRRPPLRRRRRTTSPSRAVARLLAAALVVALLVIGGLVYAALNSGDDPEARRRATSRPARPARAPAPSARRSPHRSRASRARAARRQRRTGRLPALRGPDRLLGRRPRGLGGQPVQRDRGRHQVPRRLQLPARRPDLGAQEGRRRRPGSSRRRPTSQELPNYQRISIESVEYNGWDAADWEFTFGNNTPRAEPRLRHRPQTTATRSTCPAARTSGTPTRRSSRRPPTPSSPPGRQSRGKSLPRTDAAGLDTRARDQDLGQPTARGAGDAGRSARRGAGTREEPATGHLSLVAGEAGAGKTRLLREFLSLARDDGATTLFGFGIEVSAGDLPFVPFRVALRHLVQDRSPAQMEETLGSAWQDLHVLLPEFAPSRVASDGTAALPHVFEVVASVISALGRERSRRARRRRRAVGGPVDAPAAALPEPGRTAAAAARGGRPTAARSCPPTRRAARRSRS